MHSILPVFWVSHVYIFELHVFVRFLNQSACMRVHICLKVFLFLLWINRLLYMKYFLIHSQTMHGQQGTQQSPDLFRQYGRYVHFKLLTAYALTIAHIICQSFTIRNLHFGASLYLPLAHAACTSQDNSIMWHNNPIKTWLAQLVHTV